jgi:hypothetical protein
MRANLLQKTRCYLSGPMDFVGSRLVEKYFGWRAILSPILRTLSVTVPLGPVAVMRNSVVSDGKTSVDPMMSIAPTPGSISQV